MGHKDEKVSLAKRMIENGETIDSNIAKLTELSLERIKEIRLSMTKSDSSK